MLSSFYLSSRSFGLLVALYYTSFVVTTIIIIIVDAVAVAAAAIGVYGSSLQLPASMSFGFIVFFSFLFVSFHSINLYEQISLLRSKFLGLVG